MCHIGILATDAFCIMSTYITMQLQSLWHHKNNSILLGIRRSNCCCFPSFNTFINFKNKLLFFYEIFTLSWLCSGMSWFGHWKVNTLLNVIFELKHIVLYLCETCRSFDSRTKTWIIHSFVIYLDMVEFYGLCISMTTHRFGLKVLSELPLTCPMSVM